MRAIAKVVPFRCGDFSFHVKFGNDASNPCEGWSILDVKLISSLLDSIKGTSSPFHSSGLRFPKNAVVFSMVFSLQERG